MKVRIFKPARNAMQSGTKNTKFWAISPIEESNHRSIDPLMGWTASDNTESQLKFKFKTKEEAITFAQRKNYEYIIIEPTKKKIPKKSYTSNFIKPVNP